MPYVTACMAGRGEAPAIASTDYMKLFAEQIRPYVPSAYHVLGADGFGRSDFRRRLRHHFEVDRHFVAVAALGGLPPNAHRGDINGVGGRWHDAPAVPRTK